MTKIKKPKHKHRQRHVEMVSMTRNGQRLQRTQVPVHSFRFVILFSKWFDVFFSRFTVTDRNACLACRFRHRSTECYWGIYSYIAQHTHTHAHQYLWYEKFLARQKTNTEKTTKTFPIEWFCCNRQQRQHSNTTRRTDEKNSTNATMATGESQESWQL